MQIRAKMIGHGRTFNCAVSGAKLEDGLALYQAFSARQRPKYVVLAVEPWFLNRHTRQPKWPGLAELSQAALARLRLDMAAGTSGAETLSPELLCCRELFSPIYFQHSLGRLTHSKQLTSSPTHETEPCDCELFLQDGARLTTQATIAQTPAEVTERALKRARQPAPLGPLENFQQLDCWQRTVFERLVTDLLASQVKVLFFLAPFHPDFYEVTVAQGNYRLVSDVEKYYREFARQYQISVLGSFHPVVCGCTPADFYDALHPRLEAVARLFRSSGGQKQVRLSP